MCHSQQKILPQCIHGYASKPSDSHLLTHEASPCMVKIPKASCTKIDLALVAGPRSPIDAHAVLVHPSLGVDRVSDLGRFLLALSPRPPSPLPRPLLVPRPRPRPPRPRQSVPGNQHSCLRQPPPPPSLLLVPSPDGRCQPPLRERDPPHLRFRRCRHPDDEYSRQGTDEHSQRRSGPVRWERWQGWIGGNGRMHSWKQLDEFMTEGRERTSATS